VRAFNSSWPMMLIFPHEAFNRGILSSVRFTNLDALPISAGTVQVAGKPYVIQAGEFSSLQHHVGQKEAIARKLRDSLFRWIRRIFAELIPPRGQVA